ncbi:MAG: MerR family transcriptional regulator [Robiginitomaculum sp.]|nr:MerR family transcriptional regulator [Robiginitomaculum sp.]
MILAKKQPYAYRTIGEASLAVGVPSHVLRFWETKFSQIRPMKKGGGRRYYRPEDVQLLSGIREFLYEKDFSIKQLQEYLLKEGVDKVATSSSNKTASASDNKIQSKTQTAKTKQKPATPKTDDRDEVLRQALSSLTDARDILSTTLKAPH